MALMICHISVGVLPNSGQRKQNLNFRMVLRLSAGLSGCYQVADVIACKIDIDFKTYRLGLALGIQPVILS